MQTVKEYVRGTRLAPFARVVYRTLRRLVPEPEWARMNRIYDRQTVEVMQRCLQPDSVGVDVGAHGGDLLKEMVALAPHGTHYAFEPIPHLAKGLRRL